MNKQQIELAVGTGLELLGDKSELVIPIKHNDGVFLLKQLLIAIGNGTLGLTPTVQTPPGAELPGDQPPKPPKPNPTPRGPRKNKK